MINLGHVTRLRAHKGEEYTEHGLRDPVTDTLLEVGTRSSDSEWCVRNKSDPTAVVFLSPSPADAPDAAALGGLAHLKKVPYFSPKRFHFLKEYRTQIT